MEITFNEQTNKKSQESSELKMIRRQMAPSSCAYSISEFFTLPPRERKISCLAHVMNIFFTLATSIEDDAMQLIMMIRR